jgi:transposase
MFPRAPLSILGGKGVAGKKRKRPLAVVHPNCAGIDIGSREHWVAVEPGHEDPVRRFTSFQDDLEALAEWLRSLEVSVVAMEATGVYWIPLYEVLGSKGFEVHLVNSRATRQVSGRKSDVLDCQWIQQLMSYGLLRGAYRPGQEVCALRAVVRQRQSKVQEQSRCVAHMQKALTQMNVQLDNVVSDLMGKTGLGIVRAIVAGERDPHKLAKLRDRRLRADEATVARSLYGHWREEHLFALSQALAHYDFLSGQIGECDEQIGHALSALPTVSEPTVGSAGKALQSRHRSAMQQKVLHQELQRVMGVDLTAIPTIGIETALVLVAEVGPDLSRFPSEGHFSSWLNLAPPTRITGGKPLRGSGPKILNRAGQALRQAAANARRSDSFIGAAHRARLARMDSGPAIKATAHQLARIIYAMLTRGQPYVEEGIQAFEARRRDRQLRALARNARKLGFALVEEAA